MENSYKYFENHDCKYYPCHKDTDEINCLFCYCPLYPMDNCPGNYKLREKDGRTIKSCIDCSYPHIADNYENVMKILAANNTRGAAAREY